MDEDEGAQGLMELVPNVVPEEGRADHPPGAICIASGELSRYPSFPSSLVNLLRPKGTTIEWHCGLNVAANFNAGIRRMLANPALQLGRRSTQQPAATAQAATLRPILRASSYAQLRNRKPTGPELKLCVSLANRYRRVLA